MINLSKPILELRNGFKNSGRLGLVASIPCLACEMNGVIQNHVEVHHFMGHGDGRKASDLKTVPLCDLHHWARFVQGVRGQTIHLNLKEFENNYKTQMELLKITNDRIFEENNLTGKQLEFYKIIKDFTNQALKKL